jgi:hypothetical protein
MRDNWMDCPDRERSQWWFDAAMDVHQVKRHEPPGTRLLPSEYLSAATPPPPPPQAFYALGPSAQRLTAKSILELTGWQKGVAADGRCTNARPSLPRSLHHLQCISGGSALLGVTYHSSFVLVHSWPALEFPARTAPHYQ